MSLLTICQNAAREIQISGPGSIIGNTSTESQRFLRYADKVGTWLMKNVAWQALRKEQTFTALGQERQASILPDDFDRFVPETFWDRTNISLVTGPITSVEWQALKASSYQGRRKYIYRDNDIYTIPVFDGGESLAFEYISDEWVVNSTGSTTRTSFSLDTDTSLLSEELITRGIAFMWLASEGQPMAALAKEEFEEYLDTLAKQDQPTAGTMMAGDIFGSGGRRFTGEPPSSGVNSLFDI